MHGLGRRWVVLALLLTVGLLAPAVSADETQGKTVIRIGALVDQTGASTSPLFTRAVELAVLQMNEALRYQGGDGARVEFEVLIRDTKSNATLARQHALELINTQHVMGLLTAGSGETQGVNKFNYQDAGQVSTKFPIVCFMCSSGFINDPANPDPAFADLEEWLFRVFYNSNYEAAVLSQVIVDRGGDTNGDQTLKVGILNDAGHLALAQAIGPMLSNFFSGPISVSLTQVPDYNPATLAGAWAQVVGGAPDVVVMAMLPAGAGNGIKAYRAAGYTLPIFSNNSFRRDYILADPTIGSVADGLEGSSVTLVDDSPSGQDFVAAFQAYTGENPELTSSGAYDGTMLLMLGVLAAAGQTHHPQEVTPADVRNALGGPLGLDPPASAVQDLAALQVRPTVDDLSLAARLLWSGKTVNYQGAYNPDDWNAVGDIFPPLVHWKVEDARFVEQEFYTCDPAHPLCPVAP